MAEGFARAYGSDVLVALSAGLMPAAIVQPLTRKVMQARNVSLDGHYPKDLSEVEAGGCDIIVNLSGAPLPPEMAARAVEWEVEDPIGEPESVYDRIENLVMGLILRLRGDAHPSKLGAGD